MPLAKVSWQPFATLAIHKSQSKSSIVLNPWRRGANCNWRVIDHSWSQKDFYMLFQYSKLNLLNQQGPGLQGMYCWHLRSNTGVIFRGFYETIGILFLFSPIHSNLSHACHHECTSSGSFLQGVDCSYVVFLCGAHLWLVYPLWNNIHSPTPALSSFKAKFDTHLTFKHCWNEFQKN